MIKEIINFIDYLEESDRKNNTNIFYENLELKEGIYVFLEKKGDELVILEKNIFKVDKDTERNNIYDNFLALSTNTEMLNAMKSYNSVPKVYIAIGSPFGIALNGKAYKNNNRDKLLKASEAYFKAARKYINHENEQYEKWCKELENFVKTKMLGFLESDESNKKVKDQFMFYFYMKEPNISDYKEIQTRFLSKKIFNKDKFNLKSINGDTFGVSDNISGYNDSKEFLKHKTAPFELNYRVNGTEAQKLFQFFRLQQKNKILPNPFPLFIDEKELSGEAVKFYKKNQKVGHKEIIEELINKKKDDLTNYYLIYFNNREKGSRIVDLDFIPVFQYKVDKLILEEPFPIGGKFKNLTVNNIFEFQLNILNKIFNNQLVTKTKAGGMWIKYFEHMDVETKFGNATETIVNLFYTYRKSIYDYVYKSKRQAITDSMFQDMIQKSIIDDIKHDKEYKKEYRIKEKLNIWFSLYNYFSNSLNNINMVNKTQELLDKMRKIVDSDSNSDYIQTDEEFAFGAGQLIRTILNKSQSGERSHALLEPFLQKTQCNKLKLAIARVFDTYKHEFKFYRGDSNRFGFDKIMSNVMGYETNTNLKELLPIILAGYFSETIFKKNTENNMQ